MCGQVNKFDYVQTKPQAKNSTLVLECCSILGVAL